MTLNCVFFVVCTIFDLPARKLNVHIIYITQSYINFNERYDFAWIVFARRRKIDDNNTFPLIDITVSYNVHVFTWRRCCE